jgi:hypothetical protein
MRTVCRASGVYSERPRFFRLFMFIHAIEGQHLIPHRRLSFTTESEPYSAPTRDSVERVPYERQERDGLLCVSKQEHHQGGELFLVTWMVQGGTSCLQGC